MKNLWSDIQTSLNSNLKLIHLTSAPVSVKEVAKYAFNFEFDNHLDKPLVSYDLKTIHSNKWQYSTDCYQYSKQASLEAIKEYAFLED